MTMKWMTFMEASTQWTAKYEMVLFLSFWIALRKGGPNLNLSQSFWL